MMPSLLDLLKDSATDELIQGSGVNLASENVPQEASAGIGLAENTRPVPGQDIVNPEEKSDFTLENISRSLAAFGAVAGGGTQGGRLARFALGRGGLGRSKGKDPETAELEKFEQVQKTMQSAVKTSLEIDDSEQRAKFLVEQAEKMNAVIPRSGNALIAISRQPTVAENVSKFLNRSTTAQLSLQADSSGESLIKLMSTVDGMKTIVNETESLALPGIRQKLSFIIGNAQQFGLEEVSKRIKENDSASVSDVIQLNRALREHDDERFNRAALTDGELRIASKNSSATYGSVGILNVAKDQEVRADKAKQGLKLGQIVDIPRGGKKFSKGIRDPKGSLFPELPHENGFAIIGKPFEKGVEGGFSKTTFNAVGPNGEPIRVQVDAAGNTRILPFEPVVGNKDSADEKLFKALLSDDKPPEGVPQDTFDRFKKDGPDGATITSKKTDEGFEVKDSKGNVIGFFD